MALIELIEKRKMTVETSLDELKEPVGMEGVEKFFQSFVVNANSEYQMAQ